jgi:metallo-beta-lactamase class B
MVDTPMDNDKTERLVRYLEDALPVEVVKLLVGHFHDDCMGGLEYLQQIGVSSAANVMTVDKCVALGLPVPDTPFRESMVFDFNGERMECRYFGPGHTPDNITVYIPDKQVLFGGCLIRSQQSTSLGNLSDAVVGQWDATVEKIAEAYPDIRIVVPGHGDAAGPELLQHTIRLVEKTRIK